MYKKQINPPANWQDFEDLCQRLWRSILGDENTHKHGRQGQDQHGVDVYGRNIFDGNITGIQCKGKNGLYGSQLTAREIEVESKNAELFKPELSSFIMATTSPRDAKLQKKCRIMTQKKERKFPVDVWSWDDISDELNYRPDICEALDSKELADALTNTIRLGRYDWYNRLFAFMSRMEIVNETSPTAKALLTRVLLEIIDNSFRHGASAMVELSYSDSIFRIVDDGDQYDIKELISTSGKGGHCTMVELVNTFGEDVEIQHDYTDKKNVNVVAFKNNVLMNDIGPLIIEIPYNIDRLFSRAGGQSLADDYIQKLGSKHRGIKIVVKQEVQLSGAFGFLERFIPALASSIEKVVFYNPQTLKTFSTLLDEFDVKCELL